MAKRKVRRERRLKELGQEPPEQPADCFADDCTETATTTVGIDGGRYRVCSLHAELVAIQEGRRATHRRQQGDTADIERRVQTEKALGIRQ